MIFLILTRLWLLIFGVSEDYLRNAWEDVEGGGGGGVRWMWGRVGGGVGWGAYINDSLVSWRIYASLGLCELTLSWFRFYRCLHPKSENHTLHCDHGLWVVVLSWVLSHKFHPYQPGLIHWRWRKSFKRSSAWLPQCLWNSLEWCGWMIHISWWYYETNHCKMVCIFHGKTCNIVKILGNVMWVLE